LLKVRRITSIAFKVIMIFVVGYLLFSCGIKAPPRPANYTEVICSKVR
jgi:hypothetical protein